MTVNAVVTWPTAPLTESLVRNSLSKIGIKAFNNASECSAERLLQWSTYDLIDHDLTLLKQTSVLASSYTFRKALIRKHFLHRCVQSYVTKHQGSILRRALPRTWDLDISFADELDEMWADDLYDLGEELEDKGKWWILKPGMADRGQGIRLFNSKESLLEIFERFDHDSDEDADAAELDTNVVTSQLRHFVIQEYLFNPLLIDPSEATADIQDRSSNTENLHGHKFHLRAYCVASGALTLYLYPKVLALFSSEPYSPPSGQSNLAPHLTNTSLQQHRGEDGVRLFDELIGCNILSAPSSGPGVVPNVLMHEDMNTIVDRMGCILAETFKAALQSPVHFQPLPNAFELFGVDFLVTYPPTQPSVSESPGRFQVSLLEINAEPAIELTGPRLTWILEELFDSIGEVCVKPFFGNSGQVQWGIGESKHGLKKILEMQVRGPGSMS